MGQGGGSSEPPEPPLDAPLYSYPVIIVCVRAAIGLARLRVSTCSSESSLIFVISTNTVNSQMTAINFREMEITFCRVLISQRNKLNKLKKYIT